MIRIVPKHDLHFRGAVSNAPFVLTAGKTAEINEKEILHLDKADYTVETESPTVVSSEEKPVEKKKKK